MDFHKIEEVVNKARYFSGVIQIVEKVELILNLAEGYA